MVFVVDQSGSIAFAGPDNWDIMLNFMADIVEDLGVGDDLSRFGFVKFSTNAENEFYLNTYNNVANVQNAILNAQYEGGDTNTAEAINFMHNQQFISSRGDRSDAINVAIVITDGASRVNPEDTIPEAESAQADGIEIVAIGISDGVNTDEIRGISSDPKELNSNYFIISDFTDLTSVISQFRDVSCTDSGGNGGNEITPTTPDPIVNLGEISFISHE